MERKNNIRFLNKHNTTYNEFRLHSHNCYEIVYFLSGSGVVVLSDTSYPVEAGAYCIISPHVEHTESFEGFGEILFIGFEYDNKNLIPKDGVYQSQDMSILVYFKKIIEEYKKQWAEYELAVNALLDLLLVTFVRDTKVSGKKCKNLDFIKNYIEQYFNQKIDFGELSKLSGYSYDHFRHTFKKKFGISPQDYLIDIRIENAKHLLINTGLTCTEIAYNCGFSNSAQMSSLFKKKISLSPTEYKNSR